jgi:hypothetical protein
MHKGKQVQAWSAKHPRFVFQHPPVHCSWMNQVEPWFGILRRKRVRISDFADKSGTQSRWQRRHRILDRLLLLAIQSIPCCGGEWHQQELSAQCKHAENRQRQGRWLWYAGRSERKVVGYPVPSLGS